MIQLVEPDDLKWLCSKVEEMNERTKKHTKYKEDTPQSKGEESKKEEK